LTKNVANKKGTTGVTRFQKDRRNACPSYYKSCPKVPGTFGQLLYEFGAERGVCDIMRKMLIVLE